MCARRRARKCSHPRSTALSSVGCVGAGGGGAGSRRSRAGDESAAGCSCWGGRRWRPDIGQESTTAGSCRDGVEVGHPAACAPIMRVGCKNHQLLQAWKLTLARHRLPGTPAPYSVPYLQGSTSHAAVHLPLYSLVSWEEIVGRKEGWVNLVPLWLANIKTCEVHGRGG